MKGISFYFITLALLPIMGQSCANKHQTSNHTVTNDLIVGKWQMVEYGGGSINALDAITFYENGKMDYPFETGEFTYHLIKPDSLIIYNKGYGEQHYKILKLSNDSLIKQIRRQRIYADNIDELVNGEIEKYIRVTDR